MNESTGSSSRGRGEKSQQMQREEKNLPKTVESISGNRSQDWSADYFLDKHKLRSSRQIPLSSQMRNPELCLQQEQRTKLFEEKFLFIFFPPYSLFSACSSLVSTHTNSEPPTLSLELRLWCQQQRELQEVVTLSPLVRLTRQRGQTRGQHRPRVETWSKYKGFFKLNFTK